MKITTALASASLSLVPLTAQAHAHAADHHDLTMVLIGMDMRHGHEHGSGCRAHCQRVATPHGLAQATTSQRVHQGDNMIPGELITDPGSHEINVGRREITLVVQNTGDRPIQVGSHYHFAETNAALGFDRQAAQGMRLNIAAGTAIRFEPGQQRTVALVDYAGDRLVYGFRGLTQGALDNPQ